MRDTDAHEYLSALGIPVAHIHNQAPEVNDIVAAVCVNSLDFLQSYYSSLEEKLMLSKWLMDKNRFNWQVFREFTSEQNDAGDNQKEQNLHKIKGILLKTMGEPGVVITIGQVASVSGSLVTLHINALNTCDGSMLVNLSKGGIAMDKDRRPQLLKQFGLLIGGNIQANKNVGIVISSRVNDIYNEQIQNNKADYMFDG